MRIRILKSFYFRKRDTTYKPGDVVDAPREDAELWLRHGMAMQDKSLDGASETKAAEPEAEVAKSKTRAGGKKLVPARKRKRK